MDKWHNIVGCNKDGYMDRHIKTDALIYVGMISDLCTHRWDVGVVGVRLGYNVVGLHGRHTPNHLTGQVDTATNLIPVNKTNRNTLACTHAHTHKNKLCSI
jgi:hypothetical protein